MRKIKIVYLFLLALVLIGCSGTRNIEIFRFVSHENEIQVGDTVNLQLIMGEYAEDAVVKYTFSKDDIISFEDGVATGLKVGEVVVTATVDNFKFANTKVIVKKEPIDAMQIVSNTRVLYIDEKLTLGIKVFPSHFPQTVNWSIEIGSDVATISSDGVLTPLRGEKNNAEFNAGGARVRVVATHTDDDAVMAKIDILVKYRPTAQITLTAPDDIVEFELEDLRANPIEGIQLKYVITPSTANSIVTFTSSDATVLLVDSDGYVTFPETLKAGSATITVRTIDNKTASIKFTIKEAIEPDNPEE